MVMGLFNPPTLAETLLVEDARCIEGGNGQTQGENVSWRERVVILGPQ
jgi:hypothetical protein